MTIDAVSEMTNNALYVIIKVSLPVLLVSLIVGDIHSGTDTDICTQDHCNISDTCPVGKLDDEYHGGIHRAALVKLQPVCTQVMG